MIEDLKHGLGTKEQKAVVLAPAAEIEKMPPGPLKSQLQTLFSAWVKANHYLIREDDPSHRLPPTVMQSEPDDDEIHRGKSKRDWRVLNRDRRIDRCATQLRAGFNPVDAVAFVCSQEEWEKAKTLAQEEQW